MHPMVSPSVRFALRRAFSLIELLAVIAIMGVLITLSTIGWQSMSASGKFSKAVYDIVGIIEQARAHAIAQNTYVWVVLYENAPANQGPTEVYVAVLSSNDGTDPFKWAGAVQLPSDDLTPLSRLLCLKGVHLQNTDLFAAPTDASLPAQTPDFRCTAPTELGSVTLSSASPGYGVIQITPNGAARNGLNPLESIWIGLQPSYSASKFDANQSSSVEINGFTGMATVHRK